VDSAQPCNRCILLVEDDRDIREAMQQLLEFEGYSVQTAANGREGLDRLHSTDQPCLILLDLMMPVMNGWEMKESLEKDERLSQIPVVIVTAAGLDKAKTIRSSGILTKPVEVETLLNTVQSHCH